MRQLHKMTAAAAMLGLMVASGCSKKIPDPAGLFASPTPVAKETITPKPTKEANKEYAVFNDALSSGTWCNGKTGEIYSFDMESKYTCKGKDSVVYGSYWFATDDSGAMVILCLRPENTLDDEYYRLTLKDENTIQLLNGDGKTLIWNRR